MPLHGFLRVAAASPVLRVADCAFNAERILGLMRQAATDGVSVLVFPELSLTGYTCADLFQQTTLQRGALDALEHIVRAGSDLFPGVACVGLPLTVDDQVFNCAAVLQRGRLLGLVPKSFIPNYKEFYERRWFAAAATARCREVSLFGRIVPFGADRLFAAADVDGLTLGVEICEDLWTPIPPSSRQAAAGATILVNLSASNEIIGKAAYRRQLVIGQSGRCMAAYVYASCGVWESTTDVVFGGHCLIAENGSLLAESPRFQRDNVLLSADVDLDRLRADRIRTNSFGDARLYVSGKDEFQRDAFELGATDLPNGLRRPNDAHPFVPNEGASCANAAKKSSRLKWLDWPSGSITSASPRRPSACPAASIQPWRCLSPARRWMFSPRRESASSPLRCPASAPATARSPTPALYVLPWRHRARSGHSLDVPGRNESPGTSAVRHSARRSYD